jgi:IrrE N-terminal-like domain
MEPKMISTLLSRISADELAVVRNFISEFPVRVAQLADALGLEIVKAPLSPNISGMIEPSETAPSGFKIKINKFEMPERQRFTAAHEIAHYLIHRDSIKNGIVDSALYRSNLSSAKEAEANKLAADILMPRALLLRELDELGGVRDAVSAEYLARKFKVSVPAMKVRLGINEYA